MPRATALGDVEEAGLDAFDGAPTPPDAREDSTYWVWLLHDDCAPEPGCLTELLAGAARQPTAVALGPKALDWPGEHVVDVGLTVDSSGRTVTEVESYELD